MAVCTYYYYYYYTSYNARIDLPFDTYRDAYIEINGPIPMGVSFIFSICIFVFVRHWHTAHTHLYNNNNNNISHYYILYMGRSMRAVAECTQIMSGRAKKAAPRANRSSWQAGTA